MTNRKKSLKGSGKKQNGRDPEQRRNKNGSVVIKKKKKVGWKSSRTSRPGADRPVFPLRTGQERQGPYITDAV